MVTLNTNEENVERKWWEARGGAEVWIAKPEGEGEGGDANGKRCSLISNFRHRAG